VVERVQPSLQTAAKPYVPIDAIAAKSLTSIEPKPGTDAQSSLVTFEPDDILFGAMRPYFHKVALAPFAGTTRTTVFVLRPYLPHDLAFTLLLASEDSTIEFATSSASGSTIPYAVWDGSRATMEIVMPSPEIRKSFQSLILPLLRRAQASLVQSRTLAELRDALLPKLISGELRIAEAEKKVSAA
jgi:type I restriction enzyme S subunit